MNGFCMEPAAVTQKSMSGQAISITGAVSQIR